ncbi:MAG: hypothetical protein ACRBN8_12750 [Nannocystales bacterium]
MKLEVQSRAMILATAMALAGCGDDTSEADGSTGSAATSSTTEDSGPTPSTSSTSSSGSTSSVDDTSSSSGSDTGSSTGDTTSGSDDSDGSGDSSSTGSVPTVTLSGTVTDFGTPDPLAGMSVCVFGQKGIPCATTDALGGYTLMNVPVAEGAIEFTGPSRFPSLFWGEGPMEDQLLNYNLLSTLAAAVLAVSLGEEIDDGLGHLALAVSDGDGSLVEGVSFTMTPPSGALGYLTPKGIDPMLTETTQVGFAGWLNVDVGEVEVTASHPTLTCVPGPGALVGATPDALRIDVTAGYLGSTFPFVCN